MGGRKVVGKGGMGKNEGRVGKERMGEKDGM